MKNFKVQDQLVNFEQSIKFKNSIKHKLNEVLSMKWGCGGEALTKFILSGETVKKWLEKSRNLFETVYLESNCACTKVLIRQFHTYISPSTQSNKSKNLSDVISGKHRLNFCFFLPYYFIRFAYFITFYHLPPS